MKIEDVAILEVVVEAEVEAITIEMSKGLQERKKSFSSILTQTTENSMPMTQTSL